MSENGQGRVNIPAYQIAELDVQPIGTPSAMNGVYQEAQLWNRQFGALGINAGTEAFWTPGTPKANSGFGYRTTPRPARILGATNGCRLAGCGLAG